METIWFVIWRALLNRHFLWVSVKFHDYICLNIRYRWLMRAENNLANNFFSLLTVAVRWSKIKKKWGAMKSWSKQICNINQSYNKTSDIQLGKGSCVAEQIFVSAHQYHEKVARVKYEIRIKRNINALQPRVNSEFVAIEREWYRKQEYTQKK